MTQIRHKSKSELHILSLSRNEPRLALPSGIGYPIVAERLYEELYKKTKRWTYKGKPTKKARKLKILENGRAGVADVYDLLLKR